jgi:hypothetical protein
MFNKSELTLIVVSGSVKEVENLKSRAEKAGRNGVAAAQAELTAENNPHNVRQVIFISCY